MRAATPAQPAATRLATDLVNIRAITNHFAPKVEAWTTANHGVPMTLEMVRGPVVLGT